MPYKLPNDKYPYPLSFLASDGGAASETFVDGDLSLMNDTENWFVLCLSPQELTDLLSVIDIGAPIAFPDTYNVMSQKYMQMREYPNQIPEDSCMDLCQLIIDCINDTEELQLLIQTTSVGSGVESTTTTPTANENTSLIGDSQGCDADMIFGFATGLVDFLNGTTVDIIEVWNDAVNAASRMGDMIEAIPIIGELPFDDILQFSETILQDLADNYAAAYTSALRDEYRCDLFCLAQDDCDLSMIEVFDYFNDRLDTPIVLTDVNSFVANMLAQDATGSGLVDAFFVFVIGTIQFGSNVLDIDLDRLVKVLSALFNDPDNDWVALCDSCEVLCQNYDFTIDEQGWISDLDPHAHDWAVYITDEYWENNGGQGTNHDYWTCAINLTVLNEADSNRVEIDWYLERGPEAPTDELTMWTNADAQRYDRNLTGDSGTESFTLTTAITGGFRFALRANNDDAASAVARISGIRVYCTAP